MTSKETFTHYQPLGNSDPAHTATAPGGLSAKAPAMTPLMLDTSTRKLVAWDGTTDGAAVGILDVLELLGQTGGDGDLRVHVLAAFQKQQGCHHLGSGWQCSAAGPRSVPEWVCRCPR